MFNTFGEDSAEKWKPFLMRRLILVLGNVGMTRRTVIAFAFACRG